MDLHGLPQLGHKLAVIGQHNQNTSLLTGEHPHGGLVRAHIPVRRDDFQRNIIILIGTVGPVIHELIETESIAAIHGRIAILLSIVEIIEDHLGHSADDLGDLHIFRLNIPLDFLFLVGQEDIDIAVLLH